MNGDIDEDVNNRIGAGWSKWRLASGILCDKRIPNKLKGKFYKTTVRPAMLYGTECWTIKKKHVQQMNVAEMRMLRWMCHKTRKDRIRNDYFRNHLGIAPIEEKIRENRLRWFGHIERRPTTTPVRKVSFIIEEDFRRKRGRPKRRWMDVVNQDLKTLNLSKTLIFDRKEWKDRIHVADPNIVGKRLQ